MINALGHLMPDHDNTAAFDFVKPYEQPVKIGGQAACRKCSRVQMSSLCAEWLNFIVSCDTMSTYEHLCRKCKLV